MGESISKLGKSQEIQRTTQEYSPEEIRKQDGTNYEPDALRVMLAALDKKLLELGLDRKLLELRYQSL